MDIVTAEIVTDESLISKIRNAAIDINDRIINSGFELALKYGVTNIIFERSFSTSKVNGLGTMLLYSSGYGNINIDSAKYSYPCSTGPIEVINIYFTADISSFYNALKIHAKIHNYQCTDIGCNRYFCNLAEISPLMEKDWHYVFPDYEQFLQKVEIDRQKRYAVEAKIERNAQCIVS
jgi:hypothetical protein